MSTEDLYDVEILDLYSNGLLTNDRVMAVTKQLLEATDWMGLSDTPTMSTAWATYRATLRNLESSSNWPSVLLSEWPQKVVE
tara:strand:+ start:320 stop:565 length:246 start_codon:yes stop_codon:yes gene_type:complete